MATTIEEALLQALQQQQQQQAPAAPNEDSSLPIRSLQVKLVNPADDSVEEKTAYYIASPTIDFRHEGVHGKKPSDDVTGDFKKIDQLLPKKKKQTPEDRAKEVEGAMDWLRCS